MFLPSRAVPAKRPAPVGSPGCPCAHRLGPVCAPAQLGLAAALPSRKGAHDTAAAREATFVQASAEAAKARRAKADLDAIKQKQAKRQAARAA